MATPTLSLEAVLARGYFPKELPPCFSTVAFAKYAVAKPTSLALPARDNWTRPARYNLVRPGGGRRTLSIPNPFGYFALASTVVEGWNSQVFAACNKSKLSQSIPIAGDVSERAIRPTHELKSLFDLRLTNRATCGYMLRADVLDFYGSVYTHAIPWAVVGKPAAKARAGKSSTNTGPKPWHERADNALCAVRDGQTNGIDVGPDCSFAISELLLSAVDERLQKQLKNLQGFRYYDDYELYFESRSEAEHALTVLQDCLSYFELVLNPSKTEILELPHPLDFGWALELRRASQAIRHGRTERDGLVDLFEHAFRLIASGTKEHVLRYCLSLMQAKVLSPSNWTVYEKLLWQASQVEPAILPAVLSEILRYRSLEENGQSSFKIDEHLAGTVLNDHIVRSLRKSFTHEVVWAIWGLIALRKSLTSSVTKLACNSQDPLVATMMIIAHSKARVGKAYSTSAWSESAEVAALRSPAWLLAYEASRQGVALGSSAPGAQWASEPFGKLFDDMKSAKVAFVVDSFDFSEESYAATEYDYSYDDDDDDDDDEQPF